MSSIPVSKKSNTQSRKSTSSGRHPGTSRDGRDIAFQETMLQAQSHMNPLQRSFSHFIHSKPAAAAGDFIGGTIARPNTIIYGSIAALSITLTFYTVAKMYGYKLSGAEPAVSFFFGWLVGLTIDYTSVLVRGGRRRNKRS